MTVFDSILSAFHVSSIWELVCELLLLVAAMVLPFLLGVLCGDAMLRFEQWQENADARSLERELERQHNASVSCGIMMGTVRVDVRFLLVSFRTKRPSFPLMSAPRMWSSPRFKSMSFQSSPSISDRRRPCSSNNAAISTVSPLMALQNGMISSGNRYGVSFTGT